MPSVALILLLLKISSAQTVARCVLARLNATTVFGSDVATASTTNPRITCGICTFVAKASPEFTIIITLPIAISNDRSNFSITRMFLCILPSFFVVDGTRSSGGVYSACGIRCSACRASMLNMPSVMRFMMTRKTTARSGTCA